MISIYKQIEEGIKCLPDKDAKLCAKFLKTRNFEGIKDIVESCLVMKRKDDSKEFHKEKWILVDRNKLELLALNVSDYISYLGISDTFEEMEEF